MKISDGLSYNEGFMYKREYFSISINDSSSIINILNEHDVKEATVIIWMVNGIFWGKLNDNNITLLNVKDINWRLCQEVRIFNNISELHLRILNDNKATGRIVIDYDKNGKEDVKTSEYVDTVSRLWGENDDCDNEKLVLCDHSRKLTLTLPVEKVGNTKARFYGLKTRNYIEMNDDTYQVGYGDYRYVEIVPIVGGEK